MGANCMHIGDSFICFLYDHVCADAGRFLCLTAQSLNAAVSIQKINCSKYMRRL